LCVNACCFGRGRHWNYGDWLFGTTERYWNSLAVAYDYYTIAFYLLDYEDTWCSLMNSGLGCAPNDMLLPTGTQAYPGASLRPFPVTASWDHRREWRDGNVIAEVQNRVQAILQTP
jgi:hypothetical protein